ncbi:hypothetical protein ABK040_004262 [Willaertia magna]
MLQTRSHILMLTRGMFKTQTRHFTKHNHHKETFTKQFGWDIYEAIKDGVLNGSVNCSKVFNSINSHEHTTINHFERSLENALTDGAMHGSSKCKQMSSLWGDYHHHHHHSGKGHHHTEGGKAL